MKGIQKVKISNRRAVFEFELRRNITIVRGDSGTGKTTMFEMVSEYTSKGQASGVSIESTKPCLALDYIYWEAQIRDTHDSVIFIDEGFVKIRSIEFARSIKNSDNYYVIFCRDNLHNLPYSVNEIYKIRTSKKYHYLEPMYKAKKGLVYTSPKKTTGIKFDTLITEDSKSAKEFFDVYLDDTEIECVSANANSGVYNELFMNLKKNTLVVADGAAFGSEMNRVMGLQERFSNKITVCLPESFEWLILNSGLIDDAEIINVLREPSDYIDSLEYFSWERFFTSYLIDVTHGTHYEYTKKSLNNAYKIKANAEKILKPITDGVKIK